MAQQKSDNKTNVQKETSLSTMQAQIKELMEFKNSLDNQQSLSLDSGVIMQRNVPLFVSKTPDTLATPQGYITVMINNRPYRLLYY